jgi:DNA-binding FadR family transcriptional regulator
MTRSTATPTAPVATAAKAARKRAGRSRHFIAAEKIGLLILRGDFAPGVLLPNEAEWCKRLHMSRSVIREAVKMLNAKGLVSSRPKVGTRVEPRERWNLLDRDVLLWYAAASSRGRERLLVALQEMRRIFEPEAAALAARNRTEQELEAISIACRDMGTAKTLEAFIEADVRFHLAVLAAAHNEFLVPFGMLVESALAALFDYVTRKFGTLRHAQTLHEEIEKAIRMKRPQAARRAVQQLLVDTDSAIPPEPARPRRAAAKKADGTPPAPARPA